MIKKPIVQLILVVVTLLVLFFFNRDKFMVSDNQYFNSLVNEYLQKEFYGVVKDKYIDENDHNYRKIIIENKDSSDYTLILNFERVNLYEFIQIGDSLSKQNNNLKVNLNRNKTDTLFYFRFENTKGFLESKVYDSIKDIYY